LVQFGRLRCVMPPFIVSSGRLVACTIEIVATAWQTHCCGLWCGHVKVKDDSILPMPVGREERQQWQGGLSIALSLFPCRIHIWLINLKPGIWCFGGNVWRTKFWFKNLLSPFLIQPINRFVFVLFFLLLETIFSKMLWGGIWLVCSSPKTP
jgi:hypothetical protein